MPETRRRGWKITNVDGTTHNGYRWPLPMPGETVTVEATNIDPHNKGACPTREGDGLCVVREGIVRHVTSGGVMLANCIGLALEWDEADELGHEANEKVRVRKVTVTGLFRPLELIRSGVLTDLTRAYLSGADLSGADLSGADLSRAYLPGAYLSGADLSGADLSGADLSGAYLSGANLSGADLSGADLSGADLSGAYLSRADLSRADLSRANLSRANLPGAYLSGAYYTQLTIWPDGFDPSTTGAKKVD